MPLIVGTAGHIDHGKTSLVRALTGIDCDRLEEEKRRGITIELGFAFLDLPGDERVGIVDVPGHERFVKNMVAGAAGIDIVMLVIAADEGVMPQTREHLEICQLLGTTTGLVALTKTDMVDEDWLELVQEDVREFLAGTFLDGAPIVPVSSTKRTGVDELLSELARLAGSYEQRRRSDLFRLPVDRIFTMKGYGTVITGTLISGEVGVGEDIVVYPEERPSKVRNLQWHGKSVERVEAGQRTAVNLHGLEVEDLTRGDVLARPGSLMPWQVWDVDLLLLPSAGRPLKHRKEVHFHHGSREVLARVYFLDRDQLEPGQTAVAQVRFSEPMVGVYGDRVVLRSFSPLRTIGGGKLLNPLGRKVRRFSPAVERLAGLIAADPSLRVQEQLAMAGPAGLGYAELRVVTDLDAKSLDKVLQELGSRQQALQFDRERRAYVAGSELEPLAQGLVQHLTAFHAKEPMKPGLLRGELASSAWGKGLAPKLVHFLVERMLKQGELAAEGDLVRLPGHSVSLAADQETLRETLLSAYDAGGLSPANLKDTLEPLKLAPKDAGPVLKLLTDEGRLVKLNQDMYVSAAALDDLKSRLVAYFATKDEMAAPDFKEISGVSRKYAIPLLEYLDKEKFTVRVGDVRRLRRAGA